MSLTVSRLHFGTATSTKMDPIAQLRSKILLGTKPQTEPEATIFELRQPLRNLSVNNITELDVLNAAGQLLETQSQPVKLSEIPHYNDRTDTTFTIPSAPTVKGFALQRLLDLFPIPDQFKIRISLAMGVFFEVVHYNKEDFAVLRGIPWKRDLAQKLQKLGDLQFNPFPDQDKEQAL